MSLSDKFFDEEDIILAFAKYGAKLRVRTFSKRFASEQKKAVLISGTQKNPIDIAFAGTTSEENPQPLRRISFFISTGTVSFPSRVVGSAVDQMLAIL